MIARTSRAAHAAAGALAAVPAALRRRRRTAAAAAALLVLVWALPALLPEESGLAFGVAYRIFYSVFVVAALAFFELLRAPASAQQPAPRRVLANVVLVYGVTVGGLVALGQLYPQFEVPRLREGQTELAPEERGKAIFWDRTVACFACHAVGGLGGRRAPDLTGIAARAGTRKPGVGAEQYIRDHIRLGSQYGAVPGYAPIMPPFERRLAPTQIEDLVRYLVSLR